MLFSSSAAFADAYTLSGTVFGGGTALPNTTVEALQNGTTNVVASMTTDSSGHYALTLPSATYDLRVTPPQGSEFSQEVIQDITVSGADRTYDIVLLANSGGLSGTVRGLGGHALANVSVYLYTSGWQVVAGTQTDADGHYSLPNIGTFIVEFSAYSPSQYTPDYWRVSRYNVSVAGATTLDMNLEVVTVSGTVTGDGSAVAGATVSASGNWSEYEPSGYKYTSSSTTTDSAGRYSIRVLAGTIQFGVVPPSSSSYSALTEAVTVTADATHDFAITMSSLSGTVRGLNGHPIAGVSVYLYTSSWSYLGSTTSDANGNYSIRASGPVIVQVSATLDTAPYSPDWFSTNRWDLTISGATTWDPILPVALITGTVFGDDGSPIGGATLSTSGYVYTEVAPGVSIGWSGRSHATAQSDGTYRIVALTGSQQFVVTPPAGTVYASLVEAENISGDAAHTFTLPSGASIAGTVRGADEKPLPSTTVNLNRSDWSNFATTTTDSNGYYSLPFTGRFMQEFTAWNGSSPDAPPTWRVVRYDVTATGKANGDFNAPFARVSGITTDSNGAGVPNATVSTSCNTSTPDGSSWMYMYETGSTTTASDGRYSLVVFEAPTNFNIQPPAQSGFQGVSLADIGVTGNFTQRVILQHADVTPPQIVSGPIVVHLSATSVSISWVTNEPSTSHVDYGIGGLTTAIDNTTLVTNHEITLLHLQAASTFQFRVGSTDHAGNGPTYSSIGTFDTQSVADSTPPRITEGPTVLSVDQTSALVQWTTDEPATTTLAWGPTQSLGTVVSGPAGSFTLEHSVRLTGLTAQTTYFVQVTAADPDHNTTSSTVFSFTTLAVPDTAAPVITAGPAVKSTTDSKIVVVWTTDEPATSGVSYNDGTHFDLVSDSTLTKDHEVTLSGLTAATTYNIVVSSTDAAGNGPTLSNSITGHTEAVRDTTPPVISNLAVTDLTKNSATISWSTNELANSSVSYGKVSGARDSVAGDITNDTAHHITLTGLLTGTTYFFAVTSVDTSGNSASSTEASFTTQSDFVDQPPSAPGPVAAPSLTKASSFEISWGASTDDVAIASYEVLRDGSVIATLSASTLSYTDSTAAEGTRTYQIRATDSYGHTATSSDATVVVDRTAPQITTADVSVEATGASTTVNYTASATDNLDTQINVSCTPASGTLFSVGETLVTCTASDSAGNTGSGSFHVKVKDTTPPRLNVPTTVTQEASSASGATTTFAASASDLVDGAITPTCTPQSGSLFALGKTTVTCKATDAAGNVGDASFTVDVVDTTPPVVTIPADMTLEATGPTGAAATFSGSALDAVSGAVPVTCSPASGSIFHLGTTLVTCTATDAAHNSGSAYFNVRVVDTTAPNITTQDLTFEATSAAGAIGSFVVTGSDLVSGTIAATCVPQSGSIFPLGTTRVTCTATDAARNTGSGAFNVTVKDTTAPAISSVKPSQSVLWPPDHKMVPMTVAVTATDAVTASPTCTVLRISSNEAVDGLGDGDTSPDWVIGSGLNFQLRAERAQKGPGRVYEVTVGCTDAAGNLARRSTTVTVPANQK